ncbi:MAG: ABC transporter ATP-binding protein, partial [Casimicrobium sp.]
GLTIVIISHDLDLLWQVCDRVAVLGEGRVIANGSMEELSHNEHPIVREYFVNRRDKKTVASVSPPSKPEQPALAIMKKD